MSEHPQVIYVASSPSQHWTPSRGWSRIIALLVFLAVFATVPIAYGIGYRNGAECVVRQLGIDC